MSAQCQRTGLDRLMCLCPLCVNERILSREDAWSGYLLDGAEDERAVRRMMDSLMVPTVPSTPYHSPWFQPAARSSYTFQVRSAQRLTVTPHTVQWRWAPGVPGEWEPVIPSNPTSPDCHGDARAEPFVGYRCWKLGSHALVSVGMRGIPWQPGENVAKDASEVGGYPSPGFWVLRSLELAQDTGTSYNADIIGAVEVYGKVVEHRDGWRGEKARILGLMQLAQASPQEALAAIRGAGSTVQEQRHERRLVQRWMRLAPEYGVPIFSSAEGLRSFAEEMGAEKAK